MDSVTSDEEVMDSVTSDEEVMDSVTSNEEVKIPFRYWVDTEKNSVIVAEASGDFVDVLFSFMTLPLGTIIRLGKQLNEPVKMGCINNLYESVEELSSDVFCNDICKRMLLSPRNPLEDFCQKLKVKVDDTKPTEYFMCHNCSSGSDNLLLSTFDEANCSCRQWMQRRMELLAESKDEDAADGSDGVFVKGNAMFLIYDDLRVNRSSPTDTLQTPLLFEHNNSQTVEIREKHLGMSEMFKILKHAIISKSPLSDTFLPNRTFETSYSFSPDTAQSHWEGSAKIKVMVSKSKNKILFAQSDGDFVDFLVSFLTTPLGTVLNLMNGKSSLGCIDNLYASVKNLNPSWFIGSSNKALLNPRVASQFGCGSNPLNASLENTHKYWYGTALVKDNEGRMMISKNKYLLQNPREAKLFDPREAGVRFMKRPCLFVVSDDMKVKAMTTTSSIPCPFVGDNEVDDLEEHVVEIRKSLEALNLLRASLKSQKVALTRSLSSQLKKWRYQRCPFCNSILRCIGMAEKEI